MRYLQLFLLSFCITLKSFAETIDCEECFRSPTEEFMKHESYDNVWVNLNEKGVPSSYEPFFQDIASKETIGFFGYHGSSQIFRVIQDFIRISIEEILEIPIRPDFHFLRVPGDSDLNLLSASDFLTKHEVIDDQGLLKSKQLLSLNTSLYAGYTSKGSCTVCYFANSNYRVKDKASILSTAKQLFTQLGATEEDSAKYGEEIAVLANLLNLEQGILLQLFEVPQQGNPLYAWFDKHGYASEKRGVPMADTVPSHYLLRDDYSGCPQMRLILSNYAALNPYSPLVIKRYDNQNPAAVALWEEQLRALIQTLPVDVLQKERFKAELLNSWKT